VPRDPPGPCLIQVTGSIEQLHLQCRCRNDCGAACRPGRLEHSGNYRPQAPVRPARSHAGSARARRPTALAHGDWRLGPWTESWSDQLDLLIRARAPHPLDPQPGEERIGGPCWRLPRLGSDSGTLFRWISLMGFARAAESLGRGIRNPLAALRQLKSLPRIQPAILCFRFPSLLR